MKLQLSAPLLFAILALPAHADVVWTGATSDDVFDESNWDLTSSTVTVIDPDVSINDNVFIVNAGAPVVIPELPGQMRFQVGPGFTLTLDSSTLRATGNDGVGGEPNSVTGPLFLAINGASVETFFITNNTRLEIDSTSTATFGGGATPINNSRVNITLGAVLAFLDETVADFTAEHLSKVTVDGAPAVVDSNVDVVSDGNVGCIVTVIGSPFPEGCNGDGGNQMGCTDCPCGNNSAPGTIGGCLNSAGTSGRLTVTGVPTVTGSNMTPPLRFEATGIAPLNSCQLTSGNAAAPANGSNPCFGLNSGIQSVNLDGLRCAVQGVLRHGVRPSDAMGNVGVTTNGWGGANNLFGYDSFTVGATKYFQIINRDDSGAVCQTGQNTTQYVEITFQI